MVLQNRSKSKKTYRKPKATAAGMHKSKSKSQVPKGMDKFKSVNAYGIKAEPFPRVLYTRCKFAHEQVINMTLADTAYANEYCINSITRPDFTGGSGRSVEGLSQFTALYDQYWVMGAKVKVSFQDPSADGMRVGCRILQNGRNTPNSENTQQLAETSLTYISGLNNTGSQKKNFSFYLKPWSLLGCSKLEYLANSSSYSSAIGASPATRANCLFDIFAIHPVSALTSVQCLVQIIYYVKFYSRIDARSTAY